MKSVGSRGWGGEWTFSFKPPYPLHHYPHLLKKLAGVHGLYGNTNITCFPLTLFFKILFLFIPLLFILFFLFCSFVQNLTL